MIFGSTNFGKSLDIAHRQLSALSYRAEVTANNISNRDTPNFRRSTVHFESRLREALQSEKHKPEIRAAKTHAMHMNFFDPIDYRSVAPKRILDWQTQADNNGNNVDLETERTNILKLQNHYKLVMKSITTSYRTLGAVLR